MSKRDWTPDQKSAIYAKWRNEEKTERQSILVQAAAGSGKTAVLVERIIKKLIPPPGSVPESIASVLAVTFTNAAAAEMRERISAALSKELAAAVSRRDMSLQRHLKKQLALLSNADITTIDAFCLKTIRSYFHLLNLDPNFTISDTSELGIMRDDAMDALFEEMYEENNPDFLELICMYTDGRDEKALAEKIEQIYEFTRSFPDPEGWLKKSCEEFAKPEECVWVREGIARAHELAEEGLEYLGEAARLIIEGALGFCENPEEVMLSMPPHKENDIYLAWGSYYTAVFDEYFNMKKILTADWDEIYAATQIEHISLNKKADFVAKEKQITDKELKARVKDLRTYVSDKIMKKGLKKYITMPLSDFTDDLAPRLQRAASALSDMTMRFSEHFSRIKAEKNVMDFSDIEHLCLKLFSDFPEVRDEFKEKYSEILMDEYQDSNRLQEEIFRLISRGDNVFMVGDMKQSIYRFRSSDPTIFKEKSDIFKKDSSARERKIVLSNNFRSRGVVLESINDVFGMVMSRECGGTEYDEDQRLNVGETHYLDKNPSYLSECLLIEESGEEGGEKIDKVRLEARVIAAKIREMKDSGFLVRDKESVTAIDPKTGEIKTEERDIYRPLKNKDITVLMSSFKYCADIYTEELTRAGIDCYAESNGYFERSEIKLVMSLLKIIANPYQDIPLLGVLRSPIGGFDDDDLVNIRLSDDGYIYTAMKRLSENYERGEIFDPDTKRSAEKATAFLQRLGRWRSYTKYMSSDRLLWTLFEETDIYSFVGALYGEDEACSNLRLLFERAKKYESTGYKGLFNFVRYISLLKKKNEDLSSAVALSENHDVVRLMTIHKSKGLEFPVVFVAGCSKQFNLRDTSGSLLLHRTLGFGMDCIDFQNSIKIPNITKTVTADTIKRESISEEVRKLYVAMTRAKEKLIITATSEKPKEGEEPMEMKYSSPAPLSSQKALSATNFISWILPAALTHPEHWIFNRIAFSDAALGAAHSASVPPPAIAAERDISKFMEYEYPHKNSTDIPSKVSVSELKKKHAQNDSKTQMITVPEFLKPTEQIRGAARGTVIHYIMQNIPLAENMDYAYVKEYTDALCRAGRLTPEECAAADLGAIAGFYNSPLGRRMRKSRSVMREAPFELQLSADRADPSFPSTEKIIVQGIIDCYFEEDGEYVIIDYKSDYYENLDEIRKKYTTQIELYAEAIEKITEKKVKNKYLYLFFGNNMLEL